MNTPVRLLQMILRGHADKFKTVLQEELNERTSIILEQLYSLEAQKCLTETVQCAPKPEPVLTPPVKPVLFMPEASYALKDGNIGILTQNERQAVAKLYENLNNNSRERMVKLLSESQESFNKVLKLAKTHSNK